MYFYIGSYELNVHNSQLVSEYEGFSFSGSVELIEFSFSRSYLVYRLRPVQLLVYWFIAAALLYYALLCIVHCVKCSMFSKQIMQFDHSDLEQIFGLERFIRCK